MQTNGLGGAEFGTICRRRSKLLKQRLRNDLLI
jgi:hypothetical protein